MKNYLKYIFINQDGVATEEYDNKINEYGIIYLSKYLRENYFELVSQDLVISLEDWSYYLSLLLNYNEIVIEFTQNKHVNVYLSDELYNKQCTTIKEIVEKYSEYKFDYFYNFRYVYGNPALDRYGFKLNDTSSTVLKRIIKKSNDLRS